MVHALFSGLAGAGLGAAYLSARTRVKVIAPAGGLAGGMLFHSHLHPRHRSADAGQVCVRRK